MPSVVEPSEHVLAALRGRVSDHLDHSPTPVPQRGVRTVDTTDRTRPSPETAYGAAGPCSWYAHQGNMATESYAVLVIKKWSEYLELVRDELKSCCFRGQADASWPVTSSVTRYLQRTGVLGESWLYQEWRSVEKFQARAHHYLKHLPADDDFLSWLALMQHHGAPTRLIDFTWSPYVAAFFALESTTGDAAVWALDGGRLRYGTVNGKDGSQIDAGKHDPREPEVLRTTYLLDNALLDKPKRPRIHRFDNLVWVGEPEPLNQRLISQSGTFALPSTINRSIEEIVDTYRGSDEILTKVILDAGTRNEALRDLDKMNINFATLFPGLDGLARSIGYMLETHWQFDPKRHSAF